MAILTTDGFLHIKECSSLCIEVFSVHEGMFCACMFMFEKLQHFFNHYIIIVHHLLVSLPDWNFKLTKWALSTYMSTTYMSTTYNEYTVLISWKQWLRFTIMVSWQTVEFAGVTKRAHWLHYSEGDMTRTELKNHEQTTVFW